MMKDIIILLMGLSTTIIFTVAFSYSIAYKIKPTRPIQALMIYFWIMSISMLIMIMEYMGTMEFTMHDYFLTGTFTVIALSGLYVLLTTWEKNK